MRSSEAGMRLPIRFSGTTPWKEKNGKFILSEKSIQEGIREEICLVIDTNEGEIIEYRERQRAMSLDSVLGYLENAGFVIEAYSGFDKNPASPEDFSVFFCQKE